MWKCKACAARGARECSAGDLGCSAFSCCGGSNCRRARGLVISAYQSKDVFLQSKRTKYVGSNPAGAGRGDPGRRLCVDSSQNQSVSVVTPDCPDAACRISNDKGRWYVAATPASVGVNCFFADLLVSCSKGSFPQLPRPFGLPPRGSPSGTFSWRGYRCRCRCSQ